MDILYFILMGFLTYVLLSNMFLNFKASAYIENLYSKRNSIWLGILYAVLFVILLAVVFNVAYFKQYLTPIIISGVLSTCVTLFIVSNGKQDIIEAAEKINDRPYIYSGEKKPEFEDFDEIANDLFHKSDYRINGHFIKSAIFKMQEALKQGFSFFSLQELYLLTLFMIPLSDIQDELNDKYEDFLMHFYNKIVCFDEEFTRPQIFRGIDFVKKTEEIIEQETRLFDRRYGCNVSAVIKKFRDEEQDCEYFDKSAENEYDYKTEFKKVVDYLIESDSVGAEKLMVLVKKLKELSLGKMVQLSNQEVGLYALLNLNYVYLKQILQDDYIDLLNCFYLDIVSNDPNNNAVNKYILATFKYVAKNFALQQIEEFKRVYNIKYNFSDDDIIYSNSHKNHDKNYYPNFDNIAEDTTDDINLKDMLQDDTVDDIKNNNQSSNDNATTNSIKNDVMKIFKNKK